MDISEKPGNSSEKTEKVLHKKFAFSTSSYPDDGIQIVASYI